MTMTMRLKFAGAAADGGFTDIFWEPSNLSARGSVLEDRAPMREELRALGVRGVELEPYGLRAKALRGLQRLVEQDALTEMLEEMSLSTLLYYVLAGEGRAKDESS